MSRMGNCGRTTVAELWRLIERAAAGEFETITESAVKWAPVQMATFIDGLVAKLPKDDRQILQWRLAGENGQFLTLHEVGQRFQLTRERIRQIVDKIAAQLRRAGSRKLRAYLDHVERTCRALVCPLTTELWEQWLGEKADDIQFPAVFYVRLLGELDPAIPAWPNGQSRSSILRPVDIPIETALKSALRDGLEPIPLPKALARLRLKQSGIRVGDYLEVLRRSRHLRVEFPRPDRPMVKLAPRASPRYVTLADTARMVLQNSKVPLTPEEILARAQADLGKDIARWHPKTIGVLLRDMKGIYLLGPETFGLRQHFTLPEPLRKQAQRDCEKLLRREKRPMATYDIIGNRRFDWTGQTNSHELACLLGEDERFVHLGRFLYGLAEWA